MDVARRGDSLSLRQMAESTALKAPPSSWRYLATATLAVSGVLFEPSTLFGGLTLTASSLDASSTLSLRSTFGAAAVFICTILQLPSKTAPCSITSEGV